MGLKTFTAGAVLTAADVNAYLMKQSVISCTSGTRPASPQDGMLCYETDTNRYVGYTTSNGWTFLGQTVTGSWTPTLTATSVNPTIGTGSNVDGRYTLFGGNWCVARCRIQFGSAGAAAGTGQYLISLPIVAGVGGGAGIINAGAALVRDSSASVIQSGVCYLSSAAATFSAVIGSGLMGAAAPWVWAASDYMVFNLVYEI